jgi:signal transduction histidine kinase
VSPYALHMRQPSDFVLSPKVAQVLVAAAWLATFWFEGRPNHNIEVPGLVQAWMPTAWQLRLVVVLAVGCIWLLEFGRWRLPRAVFAVGVTAAYVYLNLQRHGSIASLLVVLMVGVVAYGGTDRQALTALVIAWVGFASYLLYDDPPGLVGFGVAATSAWLGVHAFRDQRRLLNELRAAQANLAQQAIADERRRIAGEIHDIAAHSLAVTLLHLSGARMRVRRLGGDPEVIAALAEAERLGRQSLDDVRRTVGLLSEGAPPAFSQPTASDMTTLVNEYRSAGLHVAFEPRVDLEGIPSMVGLELYRITFEALANAVKHAPGAAVAITLERDTSHATVHLRIHNPLNQRLPSDGGTGLGLQTMRERAGLVGGSLSAAADANGWTVDCTLPVPVDSRLSEPARTEQTRAGTAPVRNA